MKKLIIVLVPAVALAAYPVASWVFGAQTEKLIDRQYQQIEGNAYVKLIERKTERGIFSTDETATFELSPEVMQMIEAIAAESAEGETRVSAQPIAPIRFSVRSHIKHGPFPGFSGVGAADMHSELVLPAEPTLARLYGGKSPLSVDTRFEFSGAGRQIARSPAVDFVGDDKTRVQWAEMRMTADFDAEFKAFTLQGGLPSLAFSSGDGLARVELSDLTLEGKQTRLFDDDPYLYAGPFKMVLKRMEAKGLDEETPGAVVIENLIAHSDVTHANGFIDISAGYGADVIKADAERFGPVQFDVAFRHLEAKSLSELNREYMKLAHDGKMASLDGEDIDLSMFKPMLKPMKTLLENSPEFAIDRVDVGLPGGTIKGKAVMKLPNAKVGDLEAAAENPLVLMGLASAFEATAQLSMPEAVAREWAGEEQAAMIPMFVQQGYLLQNNGVLSTNVSYALGEVAVNGKKLDPAMMGQ